MGNSATVQLGMDNSKANAAADQTKKKVEDIATAGSHISDNIEKGVKSGLEGFAKMVVSASLVKRLVNEAAQAFENFRNAQSALSKSRGAASLDTTIALTTAGLTSENASAFLNGSGPKSIEEKAAFAQRFMENPALRYATGGKSEQNKNRALAAFNTGLLTTDEAERYAITGDKYFTDLIASRRAALGTSATRELETRTYEQGAQTAKSVWDGTNIRRQDADLDLSKNQNPVAGAVADALGPLGNQIYRAELERQKAENANVMSRAVSSGMTKAIDNSKRPNLSAGE